MGMVTPVKMEKDPKGLGKIVVFLSLGCHVAMGEQYAAFDAASASSAYSSAFAAEHATAAGSGYWCSSGNHASGNTVTFTGALHARHNVLGVKINWAYGPGEYKILTSSDGGNFEEASCFRKATRSEVSYEEAVMFEGARNVKSLTIVMRSPMPHQYFGINDIALIVEPYPFMLVSGAPSSAGEECVVATDGELRTMPCLDAIAEGSGSEVFQFIGEGQIASLASNTCVSLENNDPQLGGKLIMGKCNTESSFEMAASGQMKLRPMGNYCLVASSMGVSVEDCSESNVGSKFSQVAVTEFDPNAAASLKNGANLLKAAAKRQQGLLSKLQEILPGCQLFQHRMLNATQSKAPLSFSNVGSIRSQDAATDAVARIYALAGIDLAALNELISASKRLL